MRALLLILTLLTLAPGRAAAQNEPSDAVLDARIRDSMAAAESLQGPLDGRWTLVGADGAPLYIFQIVDKPNGAAPPEGVWRDPRRPQAPGDIGLIDSLERSPGVLTISFVARPGASPTTISLKTGADGGWSGEMREGGSVTSVSLRRNG
ncbi:MAG: hypothetical protein ACHP7N_07430 [Caulobacterales bacterium]